MKLSYAGLLVLTVTLGSGAAEPKPDAQKAALKVLQGTWTIVSIENQGKQSAADQLPKAIIVVAGTQMSANEAGFKFKFALRVHPDTQPQALDLELGEEGKTKDVLEGICAVEGDMLKLCLCATPNQKARPSEFAASENSNSVLIVFKRSQP